MDGNHANVEKTSEEKEEEVIADQSLKANRSRLDLRN